MEKKQQEDDKLIVQNVVVGREYGDGVAWLRGPMIGKGRYGSVFLANLKQTKSKFRYFPSAMAVKSAEISASTTIQRERVVFSNVGKCSYLIRCYGEEATFDGKGLMIYNLLLEYAPCGTLADLIKKSGFKGLSELDVKRYTRGILRGISSIHGAGYVHCDLKPENVYMVPSGKGGGELRVKIGDLGLARRDKPSKKSKLNPCQRGTPMYMAPEAATNNVHRFASDIWSLGCIVLEMLTGKPAWGGMENRSAEELLARIANRREWPEIPRNIPVKAKDFIRCCFVKNPSYRLTVDVLLDHAFLEGLADEGKFEDSEEVTDVNFGSALLLLSNADEDDSSSFSDDSRYGSVNGYSSNWSVEAKDGEKVAEEKTPVAEQSKENTSSSIGSGSNPVEKASVQAQPDAQQCPNDSTSPAGV